MSIIPRRELHELLFIYDHHPERKDVFVEGPFDVAVVRWVLSEMGHQSVSVYEVASVDLPAEDVLAVRPKDNNRERLVYLSDMISRSRAVFSLCIVDADYSHHTNDMDESDTLFVTDFSCMEGYLVDLDSLRKYVHLGCNRPDCDVEAVIASVLRCARKLFYFRFADEVLSWSMPWPNKISCLDITGYRIQLDDAEFRKKWLLANGKFGDRVEFDEMVSSLKAQHLAAFERELNGHDYFQLLLWTLRKKGICSQQLKYEVLRQSCLMAFDIEKISKSNLFRSIEVRYSE